MLIITMEDIILNIILITFPLLVYLVLICYNYEANITYKKQTLTLSLITSLYLCFRFGISTSSTIILLFCNIPIVIAYMKKSPYLGLLLSFINIIYCYYMFTPIYIISSIKFILYYFLYLFAKKRKISTSSLILSFAILQGFFLSFEYFSRVPEVAINDLLNIMILIFVHYFVTFSVIYIFKIIEKMEELNTSVKKLEKDKNIKEALFKLTHEIKNPLAVCKGYLDMINLDNKEKSNKYITIMKDEINRSLNIMNDFLEFNKIKINKEEFDITMLLDDIYESFKLIASKQNISLVYHPKSEELYLNGDYERLKQVIINLIKNSIESIDKKGNIKLSYQKNISNININVEDNGNGMDEETLNRISEMFYTTKKQGSGLGVTLSNEIIKAHNGTLTYESKINEGTKATITLPC